MSKDNGGSAYPSQPINRHGERHSPNEGMSLRDYFAGQALMGMLSHEMGMNSLMQVCNGDPDLVHGVLAKEVYDMADAMIVEKEKEQNE